MGEVATLGDALKAVLARAQQSGLVDDKAALAHERYGAAMRENIARARRRDNLRRGEALGLKPAVLEAIVMGTLEPMASPSGDSLRAVRAWVELPTAQPVLALQGGTGCGKTVATAWAIAELGGHLRSAAQVVRAFASRALDAVEDQELMLGCRLLVLDDLGTEHAREREWMILALRELLESRQSRRTFITTNHSRAQLLAMYPDERITSRLENVDWVTDRGPDLRRGSKP